MAIEGAIDGVFDNHVRGWIKKIESEESVLIDVLVDGNIIASNVLANDFRSDLKRLEIGNGFHGFAVPMPVGALSDHMQVSVQVVGAENATLEKLLKSDAHLVPPAESMNNASASESQDCSAPIDKVPLPLVGSLMEGGGIGCSDDVEVAEVEILTSDAHLMAPEEALNDLIVSESQDHSTPLNKAFSSLVGSVLVGRGIGCSDDAEGAEIALSIEIGGKIVLEGRTRPIGPIGGEQRLAEFEIDFAEMDAVARTHTVTSLERWLKHNDLAQPPIAVIRRDSSSVFLDESESVLPPESVRRLVDMLLEIDASSLFGNALRFRKALEMSGLWMSPPLTDEHQQSAVADPALLCFDEVYFSKTYPSEFNACASAEDALETFRILSSTRDIRPNCLFAEAWYRRHRREVAQAIVCGTFRTGLDHFLKVGLPSGFSPCEWMRLSSDDTASEEQPSSDNPILEWLQNPGGAAPLGIAVRWPPGVAAPNGDPAEMVNALQRAARDFGAERGQTVLPIFADALHGKSLVLINTNTATRNYHITRAIFQDAGALLGAEKVHVATYDNLVELCSGLEAPILLCIDGQRLNSDIVRAASRYCSATALWTFDDPYNLKTHLNVADLFDLVCTNDLACVPAYGDRGFYLPLAAPSILLEDDGEVQRHDFDVFFCGTAWPNRIVLINKLMRDRPNLRYKFALTYNASVPALPLTISQSSYVQSLSFADFIRYAKRSRITLSLHRNFAGTDVFSSSLNPGPRVFEVGAAGAFQISENGGEGFEALLPANMLTYYQDYDDLLRLIDRALEEPEAREASARTLRTRIAATHTYQHRLSVLLNELARSAAPKRSLVTVRPEAKQTLPKLLYVVHNTITQPNFGGLEVHQDLLAQNLKNRYVVNFFYTTEVSPGRRKAILADSNYNKLAISDNEFQIGHANLENGVIEQFFGQCLANYDFDMVHFFHFINQTPSLAHVARSYGVPYGISFHDFYTACRQFNLLDYNNRYCQNRRAQQSDCDICLRKIYKFPEHSQLARREYYGDIIGKAATLMYVSSSARAIHEGIYPHAALARESRVHGAPIPNSTWMLNRHAERSDMFSERPTRFLVLGNFDEHKGATYLLDAIRACKDIDAEFHFHGNATDKLRAQYTAELGARAIFHGRYKPGEIDIGKYDFSLHLSIWPETYCQTLSEAWAARVVPIVTDIGALGQRVKHEVNGFKVDPARPATLSRLLRSIANDRKSFLAPRENISDDLFLDQSSHAALYDEAYQRVLTRTKCPPRRDRRGGGSESGVTMETLQRRRRTPFWNQGKGKHRAHVEIVPRALEASQTGRLRRFNGEIEPVMRGAFDSAGEYDVSQAGGDPIVLKNEQALAVSGWVERPSDRNCLPVALLRTGHGFFVHDLTCIGRVDIALAIGLPEASRWAMAGDIRTLTVDEMITGPAEVRLGWLDAEANAIHAYPKSITIVGVLGG